MSGDAIKRLGRATSVVVAGLAAALGMAGSSARAQDYCVETADYKTMTGAERKAILDALRPTVEKDLKMPVKFLIKHPEIFFRVVGDWAFVGATILNPDGSAMGKAYYERMGDVGDGVQALLHRVGGQWHVVDDVVAATDVEWLEWPAKYHAPPDVACALPDAPPAMEAERHYFPVPPVGVAFSTMTGILKDYGVGNALGGLTLQTDHGPIEFYVGADFKIDGKVTECSAPPSQSQPCDDWPKGLQLGRSRVEVTYWHDIRQVAPDDRRPSLVTNSIKIAPTP